MAESQRTSGRRLPPPPEPDGGRHAGAPKRPRAPSLEGAPESLGLGRDPTEIELLVSGMAEAARAELGTAAVMAAADSRVPLTSVVHALTAHLGPGAALSSRGETALQLALHHRCSRGVPSVAQRASGKRGKGRPGMLSPADSAAAAGKAVHGWLGRIKTRLAAYRRAATARGKLVELVRGRACVCESSWCE